MNKGNMTFIQFQDFIKYLQKEYKVYAPFKKGKEFYIREIKNPKKIILGGVPYFGFKKIFVPKEEKLLQPFFNQRQAVVGINIPDLRAILMLDRIFSKDPYYLSRRKNTLIVGYHLSANVKELKNVPFDVFLSGKKSFRVFAGSPRGRKILNHFGYQRYKYLKFINPKQDKVFGYSLENLRNKLKKSFNSKVWQDLGKRCIECGKCTIVCPTCFCFRIDDKFLLENNEVERMRSWDACFYHDFSEIAGGNKFLTNTRERIYFWYYHKFVRIPDEVGLIGCVGCERCTKACPVGIDIKKTLQKL